MITGSDDASFHELKTYVTEGRSASKPKSIHHLTKDELSELLLLNLSICCLNAKESHPGTSEAAIDALCVSGLVQYPPSEGGPLSYLERNGKESCIQKFNSLRGSITPIHQFEGVCNADVSTSATLFNEVCIDKVSVGSTSCTRIDFHQLQSEGNYLTAGELAAIGPAHGMLNKEVFLSVFMFNIVLLMFLFLIIFIVFLPLLYLCF